MYEKLEANLPHTLMQFSDTPFAEGTQLFPSRECVMRYLEDYSNDIAHLIRFEHEILEVRPANSPKSSGWEITSKAHGNKESFQETYDAVVMANGHCSDPLLPPIQGLDAWAELFPLSLHHSVAYKNAQAYKDRVSHVVTTNKIRDAHLPILARPSRRRWTLCGRYRSANRTSMQASFAFIPPQQKLLSSR